MNTPTLEEITIDRLTAAALTQSEANHNALQEAKALAATRDLAEQAAMERALNS